MDCIVVILTMRIAQVILMTLERDMNSVFADIGTRPMARVMSIPMKSAIQSNQRTSYIVAQVQWELKKG